TISVNVETGRRDLAVVVPNDALKALDGNVAEVWAVVEGRGERREVRLGLRGLAQTEVVTGLKAGDIVLADANADVQPGERVRARFIEPVVDADASASRQELPFRLD